MKILAISNLYPPLYIGGYEIECHQMCEALRRRGHDVHVLTTRNRQCQQSDPPYVNRSLKLVVPFSVKARFRPVACWWTGHLNYQATRKAIEEFKPDLVHIWSQHRLSLGCARAALNTAVPTVFTMGDDHVASYRTGPYASTLKGKIKHAIEKYIFPHNTLQSLTMPHATCISRCLLETLREKGVRINDAEIVHRGIPYERFPMKDEPGDLHNPIRLLYVGQMHAYKGVHTFLEAAARLRRKPNLPAFTLTVVGAGDSQYIARLKEQADTGGVLVDFRGKIPYAHLPAVYREHDIFVFPSIWKEPQGATHLEAMASGLPVVTTLNGGQGEFFQDQANVLGFAPGDAEELSENLAQLMQSPVLRERLVKAGRKLVQTELSFQTSVNVMENYLLQVASRRPVLERGLMGSLSAL